ncbi:unnamed protein product [Penicillium olsonii]|uniref:Uncharacterized protein n=1 Tax=Penicillium olsonii TaxID=99116 RepID=A0A9W4MR17_PENOL|nr:unnamed protein product [Penicillium olsonii]CAG8206886.1 unnamed protein product [Penicillium olsonii]
MGHPQAHCRPGVDTPGAIGRSTDRSSEGLSAGHSQPKPPKNNRSGDVPRTSRKSLAHPVETWSRSSKQQFLSLGDRCQETTEETHPKNISEAKPPRRFLPEPIETTSTTHRRACSTSEIDDQSVPSHDGTSPAPRRFKPNLIETDTRSFRKAQSFRNPSHNVAGSSATYATAEVNTRFCPDNHVPPESRFSYASLLRRQQARRHSFRVPELPSIPSSSSEESDDSRSHSMCTSVPGSSDKMTKDPFGPRVHRESCEEEFSEYLLSLAARSAHMQLRDQALAAFPNEQVYEPVDHFAIDYDRDLEEDVSTKYTLVKSRRQSSADLSWELEYMRHHKEEAEMRLRAMVTSGQPNPTPQPKKHSPPLLGKDIVIPQSLSPGGTVCEHSNVGMPSHDASDLCSGCEGLWCAAPRHNSGKSAGLWMGTCSKEPGQTKEPHGLFPGIVTPMPRIDSTGISEGLSPSHSHTHLDRLALSPGISNPRKSTSANLQKAIDSEFHDGFVTQIYNYLSLGYPCLARYYDHELSRISAISIDELRRDDLNTDARGYVVAPTNDQLADACARWKALRLYIQEWARQEPGMADDETNLEGWGLPERKGSWAI